jgi:MSHA biogenesis protein MshJ
MKQTWQRLASKIDNLGLRERIFIFLMAAVILIALVNVTLLDQQFSKEAELGQQIAQDQSQIAGIQAEIRSKVTGYDSKPDAAKLAQLDQLKQKSAQMRAALQDMQKGLVSPDRMATLLEDILKHNGKLRLVSLRTLPVSGLNESGVAEDKNGAGNRSAVEIAAQKLIEKTSGADRSLADAKENLGNRADGSPQRDQVYKHGVEIVIEGDYLDMVSYMTALEGMPWQLFWGKATLTSDDSSKLSLTLTLYTLSLDKKWLNI